MGTIKKGILGGFSGRVGNVIGGSWKGISYMRSEAQSIKNPRTVLQVENRNKFSACSTFFSRCIALTNIGWVERADKKSAFNAAVSYNLKNGGFDDAGIKPEAVELSSGSLISPHADAFASVNGSFTVSAFTTTLDEGYQVGSKMVLGIYTSDGSSVVYSIIETEEADDSITETLSLPDSSFTGEVYGFAFMVSPDGKKSSWMTRCGHLTITE